MDESKVYPLVLEKYVAAGLDRYDNRLASSEDILKILGFDFAKIKGFKVLSDEEKVLAEEMFCKLVNGYGLEYRETDMMYPVEIINEKAKRRFKLGFKAKNFSYLHYSGMID